MAEVHIIGEITEAKEFSKQDLFCKWYLQVGRLISRVYNFALQIYLGLIYRQPVESDRR